MSHFNLNNGMPRKRYIGPTHGLPCRPGTASLENLGGRIIIENEMHNHKMRLKQIKPSIDSSKPWAHDYQDTKLRRMSPSRGDREGGGSPTHYGSNSNNTSLPPATRNNVSMGGRSQSANQRPGTSMSKGSPSSPGAGSRAGGGGSGGSGFDVTSLSADNQSVYKSLVQMLSTMPQREAKSLLEQAYREGEERKLLMAYTGSFPEAKKDSSSSNAALGSSSKRAGGAGGNNAALEASTASRKSATNYSAASAASSTTTPRRPASSKGTAKSAATGKTGKTATTNHHNDSDDERRSMDDSRASSAASPKRTNANSSVASASRRDDDREDSFEKEDDDE